MITTKNAMIRGLLLGGTILGALPAPVSAANPARYAGPRAQPQQAQPRQGQDPQVQQPQQGHYHSQPQQERYQPQQGQDPQLQQPQQGHYQSPPQQLQPQQGQDPQLQQQRKERELQDRQQQQRSHSRTDYVRAAEVRLGSRYTEKLGWLSLRFLGGREVELTLAGVASTPAQRVRATLVSHFRGNHPMLGSMPLQWVSQPLEIQGETAEVTLAEYPLSLVIKTPKETIRVALEPMLRIEH